MDVPAYASGVPGQEFFRNVNGREIRQVVHLQLQVHAVEYPLGLELLRAALTLFERRHARANVGKRDVLGTHGFHVATLPHMHGCQGAKSTHGG